MKGTGSIFSKVVIAVSVCALIVVEFLLLRNESLFSKVSVAGSGGFIVVVGLIFEQAAEKERFKSIRQFRFTKKIKTWGEWLVIIGVSIEVILAGITAYSEWCNDPLKKKVASSSAFVHLVIKTPSNQTPLFIEKPEEPFGARISFFSPAGSNALLSLVSHDCFLWNMGTTNKRDVRLEFAEEKASFHSFDVDLKGLNTIVKQFNDVNSFILRFSEMDTNAELVSGQVVLHVNDATWEYEVPPQKPKWGLVTMRRIKGKNGHMISEVLPLPVTDWVNPPRFPTQVYDGK